MRTLTILAVSAAALGLGACTYVERERPAQVVTTPAPTVVQPVPMSPPPTVTVRPSY
jgi:hypothetical protein